MTTSKKILEQKISRYIRKRIFEKQKFFRTGTYDKYIAHCLSSQNNNLKNSNLEKHHILPKHAGGDDNPKNIILLTARQHILAHLIRFLEIGEKADLTT